MEELNNNLLEAAKKYLSIGFSVIPVGEGKMPTIQWKEFQTRKATEAELKDWFSNPAVIGVGIVTGPISGIVVLDTERGADLKGLRIPNTPTAISGGGGAHYYFKYRKKDGITNSVKFLPSMDTRGDGGFIISPPSLHQSGKRYEWAEGLSVSDVDLANAPKWLKDKLQENKSGTTNGGWEEKLEGVGEGQRNETAASIIGGLICKYPKNKWDNVVWPLVQGLNMKNNPPLPEAELRTTFESIANREANKESPDKNSSEGEENVKCITSLVTPENLVEMIYDEDEGKTHLMVFNRQDKTTKTSDLFEYRGKKFVPYPTTNAMVSNKFILFPSQCGSAIEEVELLKEIKEFINRYLTVSDIFEGLIPHYVQLSWIYDKFDVVPYLRATGDFGTGKSRFLQVVGSLCRKPFFAGGATTPSPIFRVIDEFNPTLVIDEADFSKSDAKAEIIKIFNCGFMRNMPVLRSEPKQDKSFDPRVFNVFCPKIIATREKFRDDALESRCLTEDMDGIARKKTVMLNIPSSFYKDAQKIRNDLLRWRFDNFDKIELDEGLNDPMIADRLNQITLPIKCLITDPDIRKNFSELLRQYDRNIIISRGMEKEAGVLESIILLHAQIKPLTMKEISKQYNMGASQQDEISAQKIGHVVRNKLKLMVERKNNGYTVVWDDNTIEKLKKKFGVVPEE